MAIWPYGSPKLSSKDNQKFLQAIPLVDAAYTTVQITSVQHSYKVYSQHSYKVHTSNEYCQYKACVFFGIHMNLSNSRKTYNFQIYKSWE